MRSKKLFGIIGFCIMFVMLVGMLAGCDFGVQQGTTANITTTQPSSAAATTKENPTTAEPTTQKSVLSPGEKVKITVWYAISGNSGETFKSLVESFLASQDEVEIELSYSGSYADTANKVSAALLSNTEPNVALMSAGPLFTGARDNYFIEGKINEADFDKDDFFDGLWEYCKYNGRVCALPYGISTPIVYYNKNILDKAGIDISNPPETWDELYELAKTAQQNGNINNSDSFWGFEVSDVPWLFKTMLNQNENSVIEIGADNKITPVFDNEQAVEVATWWKKMADEKIMPISQHTNAEKTFLAGNAAFIVSTSNRITRWSGEQTVSLGAIPMPYFKKKSVALGGNVLVLFNKDEKADYGSWKLMQYLIDAQNQTQFALNTGYLPIRKSGLELDIAQKALSENPMYKVAFDQMQYSWSYWHFEQMGTMDSIIYQTVEKIEKNVASPKDALSDAVNELKREME